MYNLWHLALLGLSMTPLLGQSNGWLIEFWATQPNCGDNGGKADTERGGLVGQGYCAMVAIEDIRAMKISDWDDGCKVSLYAGRLPCSGEPVWEAFKEEVADEGRLVDNNWTCKVGLVGKAINSVEYNCEDKPEE